MRIGIRDAWSAFRTALRNDGIRRLELAWLLGVAGDTALFVCLLVVVYGREGPLGIGLLGAARVAPAIIGGGLSAAALARWPARSLLVGLGLVRVLTAILLAAAVAGGWPTWTVFVLAAVGTTAGAPIRPAQATILPALARSPAELVAANVALGSFEGLGSFAGPIAASLLIAAGGSALVPVASASAFLIAAAIGAGLQFEHSVDAAASRHPGLRLVDGLRALRRHPVLAWATTGIFLQTLTRGLLNSLVVVVSVDVLGLGDPGVGLLNAAMGVGGLVGGFVGMSLVRPNRLIGGFAISLAYWGLPIAWIGLLPVVPIAVTALALVGLANASFDVAAFTIFQQGSANDERGATLAVFEGTVGLGVVVGSLLGPVLLGALGERGALVASGAILPIFATLLFARVGRRAVGIMDDALVELLRHVPAFAELPLTAVERLAASLQAERFEAGSAIMRQGEAGDRFVVIESGEAEVVVDGRPVRRVGRGEGVGEIALLRRSPRTATVVALTSMSTLEVAAEDFAAAIAGPAAGAAMERVAAANLERSAGGT